MLFIANDSYPKYIGDLLAENPSWEETMPLPNGWFLVEDVMQPEYDASTQKVIELLPKFENNKYFRNWQVQNISAEEILAEKIWSIKQRIKFNLPVTEEEKQLVKE